MYRRGYELLMYCIYIVYVILLAYFFLPYPSLINIYMNAFQVVHHVHVHVYVYQGCIQKIEAGGAKSVFLLIYLFWWATMIKFYNNSSILKVKGGGGGQQHGTCISRYIHVCKV